MKDTYHTGEEYSFYYTLTGYGNTCGAWIVEYPDKNGIIQRRGEVIDCIRPTNKELSYDSVTFHSKAPTITGKYNVTVSLENVGSKVYEFSVIPKESTIPSERIHGYTPAFEYHRVQINGTIAMKVCDMLELICTENVNFNAINRHDKNYTYFYYQHGSIEYLVKLDDGQICYTTDDVLAEETGIFEYCENMENVH